MCSWRVYRPWRIEPHRPAFALGCSHRIQQQDTILEPFAGIITRLILLRNTGQFGNARPKIVRPGATMFWLTSCGYMDHAYMFSCVCIEHIQTIIDDSDMHAYTANRRSLSSALFLKASWREPCWASMLTRTRESDDRADARNDRSPHPALEPKLPEERSGVVADVAFPVAIDRHDTYLNVHSGMAGECVDAARVDLPTAGSTNTSAAASHPIAVPPAGAG